jgi:hypothetical protein
MKPLSWIAIGVFVGCATLQAQINPLQYFPLHAGNEWQFYITTLNPEPPDSSFYATERITGDTLMPNGKRYIVVSGPLTFRHSRTFVRIDSATQRVLAYQPFRYCRDSEAVLFRLSLGSLQYHNCSQWPVWADTGRSSIGLIQQTARFQSYSWFDGFDNHLSSLKELAFRTGTCGSWLELRLKLLPRALTGLYTENLLM